MNLEQTTDRLILRILSADDAEKVLQFYKDNAAIFEQFEPWSEMTFTVWNIRKTF